jgi:hypothetical protein
MIQFRCDACGAYLRAKESLAGKAFACATCGKKVVVPAADFPAAQSQSQPAEDELDSAAEDKAPGDEWWSEVRDKPAPSPLDAPRDAQREAKALGMPTGAPSSEEAPPKHAKEKPRTKLGAIFPDLDDPIKRKAILPGAAMIFVSMMALLLAAACVPALLWSYYHAAIGTMGYDGCAVGMSVFWTICCGVYYVQVLVRGVHLLLLSDREQAMIGALMALVPCSPCFVFGLPVGLWALSVLRDEQVRKAFKK